MPKGQVSEPWLQDKDLVVQSLQDAHVETAKLRERLDGLDQRVLSLERASAKYDASISALEAKFSGERGKPGPTVSVKPVTKNNLSDRLNVLSSKLNPSVVSPRSTMGTDEKNGYTAAYLAFKSGRYDESTTGFLAVIKTYSNGNYIDQAYYWLGESFVAQYKNEEAIAAFIAVVKKYPQGVKHAASLLKLAVIYQNLKRNGDARAVLQRVIKEHAGSSYAVNAQSQLDNLRRKSGAKK